ncbi:lyso-ornithine lipid acyltransferase [Palleronia aestuarii]|uniref:Lyso-ornithine lipid acyltransferase n=1 Tax=Palleronia aestuarii TaxID=568105 RepID=A0A2W7NHI2_9RHOB|nr:lysophospholipid acyltransferase family protein [Palleronia aestuarii]PZX19885.1 lyso-ornithine lipid acyltransferase [Palleronia aestuarii]
MTTWHSDDPPEIPSISPRDWPRIVVRGVPIVLLLVAGSLATLVLRPVERAFWGDRRPATPWITVWVCRGALRLLGLRRRRRGVLAPGSGAVVANHASWLDILVLNAAGPIVFVSKAEVAGWPGIGLLARLTGTLFIRRESRDARVQEAAIRERLRSGQRLLLFPEGTSTDGRRVLPFKSALFAPFLGSSPDYGVQPVSLVYMAPAGCDPRFYAWWGDMDLAPHLLAVLALKQQGEIAVTCHAPLDGAIHGSRKALAREAEASVRSGVLEVLERSDEFREAT